MEHREQQEAGGGEPLDAGAEVHRRKVAEARALLAREFSIEAAFVGVPKLSRILGIAPSTIYGYMRRKEFFIPYRMFNTMAMVSLDDIAEWLVSDGSVVPAGRSPRVELPPEKPAVSEAEKARMRYDQRVREIEEDRRRSRGPR